MASWWEEESSDPFGGSDSEPTTDYSLRSTDDSGDSDSASGSWWERESAELSFNEPEPFEPEVEEKEEELSWWERESENVSEIQTEPAKPVEAVEPTEAVTEEKPDPLDINPETGNEYWREIKEGLRDGTISTAKGVVGFGTGIVGLFDMLTFGETGRQLERIGYNPKQTREFLEEFHSDTWKEQKLDHDTKEGFVEVAKSLGTKPTLLIDKVQETIPQMFGGSASGKALLQVTKQYAKYGPVVAGAIGEGLLGAGTTAEDIRMETGDLTAKQIGFAAQSGLGTTAFALIGGRLSKKLGIEDIDSFLAKGGKTTKGPLPGLGKARTAAQVTARIIGGGISEGVFEELPQSVQETVWMNAAMGRPLMDGVPESAAEGLILGGVTGSTMAGAVSRPSNEVSKIEKELEALTKEMDEGKQLAEERGEVGEEKDIDAQEVQETTDEGTPSPEPFVSNLRGADKTAMDQGKPIIETDTDGKLVRKRYDANGRLVGREVISEAPGIVTTPVQDAATAHLDKAQTGPGKTTINIGAILTESDKMIEAGATADEIIQGMEAMIEGRPSTAQEAAEVFEQTGLTGTERAAQSAEVLEEAPGAFPTEAELALNEVESAQRDGTLDLPAKSAEDSAQVLSTVEDPAPKSARESAEVFAQQEAQMNAMIAEAEAGTISSEQVAEALIQQEVRSAEESAGVFTQATQEYIAELDNAQKAAQEGNQAEAIAAIKRAVKRKGKSAEKSAAVFEKAEPIAPEDMRVKKAQNAFNAAFKKDDQKGMDAAAQEIADALEAKEKAAGTYKEEVQIEEAPELEPASQQGKADESGTVTFDETTGTPTITTQSTEEAFFKDQEFAPEETLEEVGGQGGPAPSSGRSIDVQVQEAVEGNPQRKLVQAIIDGDQKQVVRTLAKFPKASRQKAFASAVAVAEDLGKNSGVYDINAIEQNIEDIEPFTTARSGGYTETNLTVTPESGIGGIWTVKNNKTGKTYQISRRDGYEDTNDEGDTIWVPRKYYTNEKGSNEVTEHDSLKAAKKSLQSADMEHTVIENPDKKAGPSNKWIVIDSDGDVVPAMKRGKGEGYKTQKAAQAEADLENGLEPSEKTQKQEKKEYKEEEKEVKFEKPKPKQESKPKKDEEGTRKPVTRRRKKTDPKGKPVPKVSQEGTETPSRKSPLVDAFEKDIALVEELPPKATKEEVGKVLGNRKWSMDRETTLKRFKEQLKALAKSMADLGKTTKSLRDLIVDPWANPADVSSAHTELGKIGVKAFIKKYGGKSISDTFDLLESILPAGVLEDVEVELVNGKHPDGIPGEYRKDLNIVFIYSQALSGKEFGAQHTATTLIHELVHGVTYTALEFEPEIRAKLDKLRQQVAREILTPKGYAIYQEYAETETQKGKANEFNKNWGTMGLDKTEARLIYAMLNNDEFLANATNPVVRARLEAVAVTDPDLVESWIDKIKGAFQKLFGWNDKQYNAFNAVMGAISDLNTEKELIVDIDWDGNSLQELLTEDGEITIDNFEQKAEEMFQKNIEQHGENITQEQKVSAAMEAWNEVSKFFSSIAVGINVRLEAISKQLAFRMRSAEAQILKSNKDAANDLKKFKLELNKHFRKSGLSDRARIMFNMGLFNNNRKIVMTVINSGPKSLRDSWAKIEKRRDDIRDGLIEVGSLRKDQIIDGYLWHREVEDRDGLLRAMKAEAKDNKEVRETLDLIEQEMVQFVPALEKEGMSPDEAKAHVLERIIRTGRFMSQAKSAKATKQRRFPKLPLRFYEFYKDPFESMGNHFEESHEVINIRKMLGTTPFKAQQAQMRKYQKEYDKASGERKVELEVLMRTLEKEIGTSKVGIENGVSFFVGQLVRNGDITESQRDEVTKLIKGRVNQIGINSKFIGFVRNAGLASSLGHFSNTLTQLKDGSLVVYRHGLYRSSMSMLKTILRQNGISAKEYDLQRVMNDFRKSDGLFTLENLFRITGFTALDNFMKTVNLQSHLDTMKKISKNPEKFHKKFDAKWGTEVTNQILEDVRNGNITDDVKNVALTEVARDVPIFLSEMPLKYNEGANARFFWSLKSYAVKIMNVAYRDGVAQIVGKNKTKTERIKGVYDLARLCIIVGLMGGGVEEIKDKLVGKETPFWENFYDELLTLVFLNRYAVDKASTQGAAALLGSVISVPALNWIDAFYKLGTGDITGLKYIPGMKEITAQLTTGGQSQMSTRTRETIFGNIKKDILRTGRISPSTQKDIRKFNKRIKNIDENDKKPAAISFDSIKRARKRYKEEEKKKAEMFNLFGSVGSLFEVRPAIAGTLIRADQEKKVIQKNVPMDVSVVVKHHAKRLGYDYHTALSHLSTYSDLVSYAESRNDPKAANPNSTARGLYQFLEGSIDEAIKRTARMIGMKPWMKRALVHRDASRLTKEQQTTLFMGNFLEMSGSDKYVEKIMTGDIEAMSQAYYKLHHTKPDKATIANWELTLKKLIGV